MFKYFTTFSLLLFFNNPLFSQTYKKEFETLFAWEVKQIDEFFERYNFNDQTLILKYTQDREASRQLNREKLIKGLFNTEGKNWNFNEISSFIQYVNDQSHPIYLNFLDSDWFAEINCLVTWKGKPEKATLVLKVQREPNGASKWVIAGVKAKFLHLAIANDSSTSLNPLSHAIDFMNIDLVSSDKLNIANYFPRSYSYDELAIFIHEILNKRLTVDKANSIAYHFLQVDGWVFKVQQFNRNSKNSGWLISKLIKVNSEEKSNYRAELLNRKAIVK